MAETAVDHFLECAGTGPAALEARAAATEAVTELDRVQKSVISSMAAAGEQREMEGINEDGGAAEVLEIEREDAAVRVSECKRAVREWWKQTRAAAEEGLRDREMEVEERK